MKLYVSGPMSGRKNLNYPAFYQAANDLRLAGYLVSNPAQYPDNGETWVQCLKRDLADLLQCDGVAVLPGYSRSKGARLECHVARRLGMTVWPVGAWLVEAEERVS